MNIKFGHVSSKKDYNCILEDIILPLINHIDPNKSGIELENSFAALHSDEVISFETFSRFLWGACVLDYSEKPQLEDNILKMILNGVNEKSKCFWGKLNNYDQKAVEMLPVILFCFLHKQRLKNISTDSDFENLSKWFNQINEKSVSPNNWLFFVVLVNLLLEEMGLQYSTEKVEKAFQLIEKMYLGNGWYSDGVTEQKDYYVSFAIHFYSLLYVKFASDDVDRINKFSQRACVFSKDFIYWFAESGEALPFGRSLTYKFAQVAFWSALVANKIYPYPVEVIKGIINRNLRWWFNQEIFDNNGYLTVGYAYSNQNFAENYNAKGSSYWALKAFILLLLDENDDFFLCNEAPLPELEAIKYIPEAHMTIYRHHKEVQAFVNGQFSINNFGHTECKYEKYVYSTKRGFNVSKSSLGLDNLAPDSTLALSEDDSYYFSRHGARIINNYAEYLHSIWMPNKEIKIESYIVPKCGYHYRIYKVDTARKIYMCDSGFSLEASKKENISVKKDKNNIILECCNEVVGMGSIFGEGKPDMICASPNTNVLYPRVVLPTIKWLLNPGKYCIITYVFSSSDKQNLDDSLEKIKNGIVKVGNNIRIDESVSIDLGRKYKKPNPLPLLIDKVRKKLGI